MQILQTEVLNFLKENVGLFSNKNIIKRTLYFSLKIKLVSWNLGASTKTILDASQSPAVLCYSVSSSARKHPTQLYSTLFRKGTPAPEPRVGGAQLSAEASGDEDLQPQVLSSWKLLDFCYWES